MPIQMWAVALVCGLVCGVCFAVMAKRAVIPWRWVAVLVAFQAMALLTAAALLGWRV